MNSVLKKQTGVFYTANNPFDSKGFLDWADTVDLKNQNILEPFAGSNNLIDMLTTLKLCHSYKAYDINPTHKNVAQQDTLKSFPTGFAACVTNPPYLYKSRARRLGLEYPDTPLDNLYKYCLELCLDHCDYVAILIPASFLNSKQFLERLKTVILLQRKMFNDTDNPVCLALFNKNKVDDTLIYLDDKKIGYRSDLSKYLPTPLPTKAIAVKFNDPNGSLGLIAIDNTREASIRFCDGDDLSNYTISHSSRSITRIGNIDVSQQLLNRLNDRLKQFREDTYDIFMTPFKGLRKDGTYRKRIEFSIARKLIAECAC